MPAADVEEARLAILAAAKDTPEEGSRRGPAVAVVIGRPSLAEPPTGPAEGALMLAALPGVAFLPALRCANVHGAIDLGLAPGLLPGRVALAEGRGWYERHWGASLPARPGLGTLEMLQQAAAGHMEVLFLVGADPLSDCPDRDLAARAL